MNHIMKDTTVFLSGRKCYLRGLLRSDLQTHYFQWLNDQDVTRFMWHGSFPNSESRMEAFFDRVTNSNNDVVLAIVTHDDDVHIGNIGLANIDWMYRKAELGILIGEREHQERGYASEALDLVLRHAFYRLNLNKVYLRTEEGNESALHAFERAGFKREGLLRQECFREGEYRDTVYMGCLRADLDSLEPRLL
jgi:RimJ/RimL family protein N-acetyltransferase